MSEIYDISASRNLLGCLLNNPRVLLSGKYNLTRDDFKPNLVHYRLFAVIENLTSNGAADIDWMMISQFVETFEEVKELFADNNTEQFVEVIKGLMNADNIEIYVDSVKKCSALREYLDNGFNVDKFFDITKDEESQFANLARYSLDDIIDHFDLKNSSIKRKFDKKNESIDYTPTSDDLKMVIQSFEDSPMMGYCMQSPYLTTLGSGALRGHLWLRSGGSGSGKSTMMIADACLLSATELYDEEKGEWITNTNRQGGNLHIHSESKSKTEIMPIYLSYIAKVERRKIKKGLMDAEEKERVMRAAEIIAESDIHIVYDPKYTIPSIKNHIEYYTKKCDIFIVTFDYIAINNVVNVQLINETKNFIPDHQVLLIVAEELKHIAEAYDIFVLSATQLNGKEKEMEFADNRCLSASSAIVNKLDLGCISLHIKAKERKQIEPYLEKRGFNNIKPNRVLHVFKGRDNDTGYERIKVFQYVDLSTATSMDMFCTDEENNLISIPRTILATE